MVVRSETPDPAGADQSLGDLVALATKDASQLLRYEIDLAKTELKSDVKRVGIAAGLAVMAAFVACLVIVLLCIAYGFGLIALGIWAWAAFLIVTGTCILLAAAGAGDRVPGADAPVWPARDQEVGGREPRRAARRPPACSPSSAPPPSALR